MTKVNLRPLNDKIVVKRLEAEEKTKGGIVLPDTAKAKPRILFSSYAGTEVKVGEEEYLIMSEDDVLAIVEE